MSENPFLSSGNLPEKKQEKLLELPSIPPVAAETVHARGGKMEQVVPVSSIEDGPTEKVMPPEKGDIYENGDTGGRMIVEGIRKEGKDIIVQYSFEIEPGVREEPGENFRELPLANFAVKRATEGYLKEIPISETRREQAREQVETQFSEIFDACQDVFEGMNKAYQKLEDNISPEAQELMERVGELAARAGELSDAWDILSAEEDQTSIRQQQVLLERLKNIVGRLPESLVQSNSLLSKIHREYQSEDEANEGEGKKKEQKKGKKKRADSESQAARRKGDTHKGRTRDIEGLETMVSGEKIEQKTRRDMRQGETSGPEIDFHAYRKSSEEVEDEWRDETIPLSAWIDTIRQEQADLVVVVDELKRLGGVGQWEEALAASDAEHQQLALKADRESVAQYLDDLDTIFIKKRGRMAEAEKATRTQRFAQERPELKRILFGYYAILRTGEAVINELRQKQAVEGTKRESAPRLATRREPGNRRGDERQRQEKMPSGRKIQGMLWEAQALLDDWKDIRASIGRGKRGAFDQAVKRRLGIEKLPQFEFQRRWLETQHERTDWGTPEAEEVLRKLDDKLRKFGLIVAACRREVRRFQATSKGRKPISTTVGSRSLVIQEASKGMGLAWEELGVEGRTQLTDGLKKLVDAKDEEAGKVVELLQSANIPTEAQGPIVLETLAPAYNAEITRVLQHVNVSLPPEAIEQMTQGLLEDNSTDPE